MKRRHRPKLRPIWWTSREWLALIGSLALAGGVALLGAAINFNVWLEEFFKPHAGQPAVEFVINFLFVWLVTLLILSYLRWRRAALYSQELEDIIDSINPDVLLVVDKDRTILMSNKSVERMFGYPLDDLIGRKTDVLYFDRRQVPGQKHEIYDALEREGFHVGAASGRKKDGKVFPLEIITGLMKRHGGSVLLLRDTTERQRAEEMLIEREGQLRQSQKMEALGLLAGGVAHDFNNLLTSILGFSTLALETIPEEHAARSDLREVIAAAERAAKLTSQLLTLGRKQALQVGPLEMNSVVGGMAELLRRTLSEEVVLNLELDPQSGHVLADKGGIEQVLLNLAVNARDAMPKGGQLSIQTAQVTLDEAYCLKHVGVEPGAYGRLLVRDSGEGMTRDVQERVFEPFFTTKERGKGTGLGLSMVYGIVRQCQGYIEFDSTPGKGSEFRVYFKTVQCGSIEGPPAAQMPAPVGTETILIVEDEPALRTLASRVLGALGYRVLEAASRREALELCNGLHDPIHLVLMDLVLPDGNGADIIAQVRAERQDFRVLYVSGFGTESVTRNGRMCEHDAVIGKPYSQDTLARKVREVLDA
jgi:two-component system cell cycle sensor histidine kinase/response regulator CckA